MFANCGVGVVMKLLNTIIIFQLRSLSVFTRRINTEISIQQSSRNPRQLYQNQLHEIKSGIGCADRYDTIIGRLLYKEIIQHRSF
jgi:hypothetical protein